MQDNFRVIIVIKITPVYATKNNNILKQREYKKYGELDL